MSGLPGLPLDVMRLVVSFQSPHSLCSLEATCKLFSSRESPYYELFESAWQSICIKRWNLVNKKEREFLLKVLAAQKMKTVYHTLAKRYRIPRGKYTDKFSFIFGRGDNSGVQSWLLVGHRNNTELLRCTEGSNTNISVWHRIELRICVQNIFNHMATIDLEEFCQSFTFCTYKSYPESGVSSPNVAMGYESNGFDRKFSCVNVKVMSTNGLEYVPFQKNKMIHHSSQSTVLNLGPFDFAVLSCGIICPPCVRNETDFLTMMNKITFQVSIRKGTKYDTKHPFESKSLAPYSATNGAHDALDIETSIPIELFDESTIWDHYLELPGGIVLLRDRPLSSIL